MRASTTKEDNMYAPSFRLDGKTAVVTGAGRGIGKAIALGLAEAGADIVLMARTRKEMDEVAGQIGGIGRRALVVQADLTNKEAIEKAFDEALGLTGRIDILVNNAGVNPRTPTFEVDQESMDKHLKLNLEGAFFCSQAAGRIMSRQGGGRIISIASVAAQVATKAGIIYSMTKAAVVQMTKTLAVEWGKYGINVNAIGPWYIRTSMTEEKLKDKALVEQILSRTVIQRISDPEDLVGTAIFLSSDASSYITGQTIFVDGGLTIYGF